jgi:acyl transferase domain-containing protein
MSPAANARPAGGRGTVFLFPGQGSYDGGLLHELCSSYPETEPWFVQADDAALRLLGEPFLPLVTAAAERREELAEASPDLQQLGIFLAGVASARLLERRGMRPDLLVGHSFGELAALGAADAFDLASGFEIVCRRVLALRSAVGEGAVAAGEGGVAVEKPVVAAGAGAMAALSCGAERAEELLRVQGGGWLEIAVINHPRQTVVSGPRRELEDLAAAAAARGISLTYLKSRYPFHSSLLAAAVEPFAASLRACEWKTPRLPVYLAMERRLLAPGLDLPALLSSHLVRRLDFAAAVQGLHAAGYRRFLEVGSGDMVGRLVLRNLATSGSRVAVAAVAPRGAGLREGMEKAARLAAGELDGAAVAAERDAAADVTDGAGARLDEMVRLLRQATERIDQAARLLQLATATAAAPRVEAATLPATASTPAPRAAATRASVAASAAPREAATLAAMGATPGPGAAANGVELPAEPCPQMPIAIVAMGCVLPGAGGPEELWHNVLAGVSGIVDLAEIDPRLGSDFVAGRRGDGAVEVVPDKTYTLLNGAIREVRYDARRLAGFYTEDAFAALTRGQQLLASALGQSLAALPAGAAARGAGRTQCVLGATADGSSEYDEALFAASVRRAFSAVDREAAELAESERAASGLAASGLAASGREAADLTVAAMEAELPASAAERRRGLAARLEGLLAPRGGDGESLGQQQLYGAVVRRLLGEGVSAYVVDAACSSSLYALDLGIAALRGGEADLVLAGGVFAPGPANNALFAQFRGLTPTASRPLDVAADGVVFGDGAAVVALQRLPDALAAGARVLGVIRGLGLSSDGRSASVNVPQKAGQSLAIRRAYAASGLSLDTIQLVEAHATATPVGDAVELASLAEVFAARSAGLPPVQLGSVKALIGHTGWVSGVASLIKVLLAFAARTVPPQHNFSALHPDLALAASSFEIARRARPWPANLAPFPRRAGIDGFGFGGTNAHLVVEEFDPAYHGRLCGDFGRAAAPPPAELVVVGAAGLFPAAGALAGEEPSPVRRFARSALRLPAGKLLLPDVTEHMDASQYLTALAAERILGGLPRSCREIGDEIGVVVGLAGKTERGVRANERIFLDRLRRLAAESAPSDPAARQDEERLVAALAGWLERRNPPSGPYTLPGLMPNVAASRVSNLFGLKGPNLVIDAGAGSLRQALAVGAGMLGRGVCRLVLAGGVNAAAEEGGERQRGEEKERSGEAGGDREDGGDDERGAEAEGILLLALAAPETARELGLPVLAMLRIAPPAAPAPVLHGEVGEGAAAGAVGEWGGAAGEAAESQSLPPAAAAGAEPNGAGQLRWRGAQGIVEVLAALRQVREKGEPASAGALPSGRCLILSPAAANSAAAAGVSTAASSVTAEAAGVGAAASSVTAEAAGVGAAEAAGVGVAAAAGATVGWRPVDRVEAGAPRRPETAAPMVPMAQISTHAYVQGTPLEVYTPVLVAAPAGGRVGSIAGRRVLVLADQPDLVAAFLASGVWSGAAVTVACPANRSVAGALALDLDSAGGLAAAGGALAAGGFDTIVAVERLAPGASRALLLAPLAEERRLLDLLFVACQQAHGALGRGEAAVYGLCLDAFAEGRPHAFTGLLGGFCKSLSRELPAAAVRCVHTDSAEPRRAWRQLLLEMGEMAEMAEMGEMAEIGATGQERGPVEVCWRGGRREVFALSPLAGLAAGAPCLDADSVVLATAGGRGVTAVLAEELLCRFGCTVVAVGRTDPAAGLPALAGLSDAEVAAYEGSFYREQLARDPAQKITGLKRRFAEYRAVAELQGVLARLGRLPGRYEYHPLDLHDEAAVAALVGDVLARHGRLDMVVHGAGIQMSQVLPKKSLSDFRRIVATKLGGLAAIYRSCRRHAAGRPVHFHLLSSAFSYLGNDGQPDYGAANEAMNRLAAVMDGEGGASWSSFAWLGWAGVGMTRGSEFAALAASRRLRGVTPAEGREIFGRLMAGRPSSPVQVLLAEGERNFYRPLLAAPPSEIEPPRPAPAPPPAPAATSTGRPAPAPLHAPAAAALVVPLEIDLASAPYLRDHLVHGVPTLPGALLLGIAAEAASRLRPGLAITAFENTSFRHFVRVYEHRPTRLRLDTRVVEEERGAALVRVQVREDFVHKSGVVLQRDVVQTEIGIRMAAIAARPPGAPGRRAAGEIRGGLRLPDPYLLPGSPVRLNGIFKTLDRLAINGDSRLAHYRLGGISYPGASLRHLLPNVVLVDAFWRFGTVMATGEHTLAVYVPERCDRMGVYFDYTDFDLGWLLEPAVFTGANPRPEGDRLLVGPIEVRDMEGRLRLTVEGGVCRKFGEIHDAF